MRLILLTLALSCLFLTPIACADEPSKPLPEVKAIESYLNSISTLQARFVQTAYDSGQADGTFLLKRPGRMRFDYAPPVTDFIVADGTFVYYYDGQMKQQSNLPISQSLANFFLREKLTLEGNLNVTDMKHDDGLLQITLAQSDDLLAGSLTLMFSEQPLQLKKWHVVDAQGLVTKVELFDIQEGITLSSDLFHYYDPTDKKPLLNK